MGVNNRVNDGVNDGVNDRTNNDTNPGKNKRAGVKHKPAPLWLVAFSILLPTSFSCLATSATNVAIPHISGYFGSTIDEANWIITSYMIANACLILMSGWLEGLLGRKNFLKIFITIFTLGSLMCAVAPNLNLMVLGRLIQGIGGGPMTPVSQSILLSAFPREQRGVAMSLYGLAVMVFAILGPTFGGFIVDNADWQWIYLVNVPVGILSVSLVHANIEDTEHLKKAKKTDFPGMISLVLWLLSMQVVLDKGQQYNWFDCAWISWLAGFSACSLAFFIVRELEASNPLINLRLFKDKNFFIGTILSPSINMIVFSTIVLVPQFLQNMMGYTAILSGYVLAPRIISCVLMMIVINPLMKIFDNRILIALGFFLLGVSVLFFVNLNLSISFIYMAIPQVLMGVGVILTFIPVSSLVLGTLPKSMLTSGASLHNLCKSAMTAIIASVASTLVARHSQMHQVYLVDNLSNFNLVFQQKFSALLGTFMSNASSSFATIKTNSYMYKSLLTQSRLMAYVDVFAIFALISFLLIPLAFLFDVENKHKKNQKHNVIMMKQIPGDKI